MGDTISFSQDNVVEVRDATIRTLFRYLRNHALDQPELRTLVANEEEFDAIGGVSLDDLSSGALTRLQELISEMSLDLPSVAASGNWKEEWRHIFYSDMARIRSALDRHVQGIARKGTR